VDKDLDRTVDDSQWDLYPSCYQTKDFSSYEHAVRKQPGDSKAPSYFGIPKEELKKFPIFDQFFKELNKWSRKKFDPDELRMMDKKQISDYPLGRSVSIFLLCLKTTHLWFCR